MKIYFKHLCTKIIHANMANLVKLYETNPDEKKIDQIVALLKRGGIIIYPTDTVYGIGCDITHIKAMEKIALIKGVKLAKANFSFICNDLSHISNFTKPIPTTTYKILKRCLPGAFTFILEANNQLPKAFKGKKTIGIRVPDNNIPRMIVEKLGNPILTTSVLDHDEILEYTTDPELILERHDKIVDLVIDGGYGDNVASTIVDLSQGNIDIIREGKGDINLLY